MNWSLVIVLKLGLLNLLSHIHALILHTLSINIVILETKKKKWAGGSGRAQQVLRAPLGKAMEWTAAGSLVRMWYSRSDCPGQ